MEALKEAIRREGLGIGSVGKLDHDNGNKIMGIFILPVLPQHL